MAPCGQYLTNFSLPSGESQLNGTDICTKKMMSDRSLTLVTWYDYGPGAPTCGGNKTTLELDLGFGMLVTSENAKQRNYDSFRKTVWYKYIWLVLGNFQIMVIINLIIYCRRRVVKNLEKDKKHERQQDTITKALSATEKL